LVGAYRVAYPALASVYREHLAHTNPLVDQPTVRILRAAVVEIDDAISWGARAFDAVVANDTGARRAADEWTNHLNADLSVAGGVGGDATLASAGELPPPRASVAFEPDFHPRRDERFQESYNFEFPPHDVYNMAGVPADERNLALLCKRALEIDVPEMMASFITERDREPWNSIATTRGNYGTRHGTR
jgi:hypothetical protein